MAQREIKIWTIGVFRNHGFVMKHRELFHVMQIVSFLVNSTPPQQYKANVLLEIRITVSGLLDHVHVGCLLFSHLNFLRFHFLYFSIWETAFFFRDGLCVMHKDVSSPCLTAHHHKQIDQGAFKTNCRTQLRFTSVAQSTNIRTCDFLQKFKSCQIR
jgi:hypothetical protein